MATLVGLDMDMVDMDILPDMDTDLDIITLARDLLNHTIPYIMVPIFHTTMPFQLL